MKASIIEWDKAAPAFAFFDIPVGGLLELDGMTLAGVIDNNGDAIQNLGKDFLVNTTITSNRIRDVVGGGIATLRQIFGAFLPLTQKPVSNSYPLHSADESGLSCWGGALVVL